MRLKYSLSISLIFLMVILFHIKAGEYNFEVKTKSGNIVLYGTLSLPTFSSKTKLPVAIIVPGARAWDRDGNIRGGKPYGHYQDIAKSILTKNVAVLRYDKRGVGKSGGFLTHSLPLLAKDLYSWINYLKKREDIDINKLILIGHSQGTLVITYLLKNYPSIKPLGVALLSPVLSDYLSPYVFNCPLLIIYGSEDSMIDKNKLKNFVNILSKKKIKYKIIELPGGSHILFDVSHGEPDYFDPKTTAHPLLLKSLPEWIESLK